LGHGNHTSAGFVDQRAERLDSEDEEVKNNQERPEKLFYTWNVMREATVRENNCYSCCGEQLLFSTIVLPYVIQCAASPTTLTHL
jgi:hypothetical protein